MFLKNNVFNFEGNYYKQINDTATGTPMAPAAANLFMGLLETKILDFYPDAFQREFWKRFINDIFLFWTDSLEKPTSFLDFINSIHPTIKFTSSVSYDSIPFLDINIKIQDGYLKRTYTVNLPIHMPIFTVLPVILNMSLKICHTVSSYA